MKADEAKRRPPIYQIVSCCVCAPLIGLILWRMTLKSDAVVSATDQLFLLFYIGLAFGSYVGSLMLANRFCNLSSTEAIPGLMFVSLIGVSVPFVLNTVHIWFVNYRIEIWWFIEHSLEAFVLLNMVMVAMMALCAAVGFGVSKLRVAFARVWRSPDIAGI